MSSAISRFDDFLFTIYGICESLLYRFRDIRVILSKVATFPSYIWCPAVWDDPPLVGSDTHWNFTDIFVVINQTLRARARLCVREDMFSCFDRTPRLVTDRQTDIGPQHIPRQRSVARQKAILERKLQGKQRTLYKQARHSNCSRAATMMHYMHHRHVVSSSVFLHFPRLISAVADWMSTILPHMVWPQCEFRMQV